MNHTNHQARVQSRFVLWLLPLMILLGCAKEMDERLPDNAYRDIHSLESFSQPVVIETLDETPGLFKLSTNEMESSFLAHNELSHYPVRMVEGPENLRLLFKDLKVEASAPGVRYQVEFKLSETRLSAYLVVEDQELSTATKQLLRSEGQKSLAPLFHYSPISYGFYKNRINQIDEQTRFLDFEISERTRATHLQMVTTPELRRLDGIYAEPDAKIMVRSRLHNKSWSVSELVRFFETAREESSMQALSPRSNTLITKILDDKLYVYRIMLREDLTPLKERFLESGDKRIQRCDDSSFALSGLEDREQCILEAALEQEITHVRLALKTENGQYTGSVRIERDVDHRTSQLIELPLERQVQVFRFQDVASLEEDNLFRRGLVDNAVHEAEVVARSLNMSFPESTTHVQTKLVGSNLLFMSPRALSDLNELEYAAYRSNDPRFDQCPSEILRNWTSEDECVMVTTHYRTVSYADVRLINNENNELEDVVVDQGINRGNAQLLRINVQEAPSRYIYSELIGFRDLPVTVKSRDFDFNAEYLYVPYTLGTPREVLAANPFFKGQEKIVNLRMTQDGLEVVERERDPRFQNNPQNDKPVLLIPGAHMRLQCVRDDQGDCTMTDIPDNHATWDQSPLFLPAFENMRSRELNMLELMSAESDPCVSHVRTSLKNYTIEDGVLNVTLEKTFKTNDSWRCIRDYFLADTHNYTGLSNAGFKVDYHYSLVRLDKLVSTDYEPVNYPIQEHSTFGFFKNYERSLNDFFESRRYEESFLMNRWNPKKTELVYHLSDSFNEPSQALIKQATYRAVEGINRALNEANANFTIRLEEPSGKHPGDLRYNVIQLITDPLANGLLGYAPTVKNPRTGEIVNAHINMYSGVLQSLAPRVWDNMVALTRKQRQQRSAEERARAEGRSRMSNDRIEQIRRSIQSGAVNNQVTFYRSSLPQEQDHAHQRSDVLAQLGPDLHRMMINRMKRTRPQNYVETRTLSPLENRAKIENDRLNHWAENNAYAVEFFRVAHTAKALLPGVTEISGVLNNDGTLKPWKDLTREQRRAAGDIIVPYAYTSTFVHEFGHSLGLRHNFSGSFDAANFYSDEEARARGLRQAPAYSSIMDYAFSEMNELTIFGKYDVAALRFAYAREVELTNGEFVKVETTLTDLESELEQQGLELKRYMFCTDDNAGLSSMCNRFDEGSTLTEIAKHLTERYEDDYRKLNFRDGRNVYKDTNVLGITLWNMRLFENIRDVFEDWEFFTTFFDEGLMAQGCNDQQLNNPASANICRQINDRRDAALIAGQFFINVIKTPDHTCAILKDNGADGELMTISFKQLYEGNMQFNAAFQNSFPESCFDPRVVELVRTGFSLPNQQEQITGRIVAEGGKHLNDIRGNDDRYIYADDRSVVGTWSDRLLAMRALMKREKDISLTETGHMAFVEHPAIMPQFMNIMAHLLLNQDLGERLPFRDRAGNEIAIPYKINDLVIESTADDLDFLKHFFGINTDSGAETSLIQGYMSMINRWSQTNDRSRRDSAREFHNMFAARRADISTPVNMAYLNSIILDDTIYMTNEANPISDLMVTMIRAEQVLNQVASQDLELLQSVFEARFNPTMPELTEIEQFALSLPEQLLEQLVGFAQSGADIPLANFQSAFGEEPGRMVHTTYVELGFEGLSRILSLKRGEHIQPPADASDIERELYSYDLSILQMFAEQKLGQVVEHIKAVMRYLPEHIRR